ncbi:hypothetical protein [Streptomyces sp. NPDC006368]|uniref:hypothetical protein n=1 Tax=Streptomyces sp. NPDC006368 TaxID=3156760 RepID=UPI00339DB34D
MGEPGQREEREKSPLERVTGENDVTPDEERERSRGARPARDTERTGAGEPGKAHAEDTERPDAP